MRWAWRWHLAKPPCPMFHAQVATIPPVRLVWQLGVERLLTIVACRGVAHGTFSMALMTSGARRPAMPRLRLVAPDAPGPISRRSDRSRRSMTVALSAMRAGDKKVASLFHDRVRPQVDRTLRRLFDRRDWRFDNLRQQALVELVFTIHRFRGECSLDSSISTVTGTSSTSICAEADRAALRRLARARRAVSPGHSSARRGEALARSMLQRAPTTSPRWTPTRRGHPFSYILGYELVEVAQTMGITVAAAQTRLVRGRDEVHDRLATIPT